MTAAREAWDEWRRRLVSTGQYGYHMSRGKMLSHTGGTRIMTRVEIHCSPEKPFDLEPPPIQDGFRRTSQHRTLSADRRTLEAVYMDDEILPSEPDADEPVIVEAG